MATTENNQLAEYLAIWESKATSDDYRKELDHDYAIVRSMRIRALSDDDATHLRER